LKVIQLLRSSPFGIEGSYLLCFRFQLFKPSLPIPTAEFRVISGYAAGKNPNPTYEEVCTGQSGHAEVVQITYDPSLISYEKIIELFWDAHDPTTLNRQGADRGTQYRSIIIAQSPAQRAVAEKSKADAQARFRDPIVTEIIDETEFFPAESYHQDFTARNPNHPYVQAVIAPKLEKLKNK
jgi:peptide-methionine (S)-S-oxide reductase